MLVDACTRCHDVIEGNQPHALRVLKRDMDIGKGYEGMEPTFDPLRDAVRETSYELRYGTEEWKLIERSASGLLCALSLEEVAKTKQSQQRLLVVRLQLTRNPVRGMWLSKERYM